MFKNNRGNGGLGKEEEGDTDDGDDGTEDCSEGDALVEQPVGGQQNDDGRHGHERGGDASGGVLHGHEREAHTHKRSEDGGCGGYGESLPVVQGLAQWRHAVAPT